MKERTLKNKIYITIVDVLPSDGFKALIHHKPKDGPFS